MNRRRIQRGAARIAALAVCCVLGGCSFSLAGIPIGGRKELVFTCDESLDAANVPELPLPEQKEGQPPDSRQAEADPDGGQERASDADVAPDGRVNINTAGLEELTTLKGVGESRAEAIIEYRQKQGPFETIEDIMQIPGIKEGVFSKIKDQIAVR